MSDDDGLNGGKIFLRVPETLKRAWVEACKARKIKQNVAGEALIRLVVGQDDEGVQAMMFGQITPKDGVIPVKVPKKQRVAVDEDSPKRRKSSPRSERDANPSAARH